MVFSDVYSALDSRNWYALASFTIWCAIVLWKKLSPDLYYKIPDGWRWAPPLVIAALTGFIDGYTSGLPWQQSALRAGWALLTMGLGAMGVHGALVEAPGPYGQMKLLEDPISVKEE